MYVLREDLDCLRKYNHGSSFVRREGELSFLRKLHQVETTVKTLLRRV